MSDLREKVTAVYEDYIDGYYRTELDTLSDEIIALVLNEAVAAVERCDHIKRNAFGLKADAIEAIEALKNE